MRDHVHRWIQIKTGPQQCADLSHDPPKFSIQSSRGAPRIGARALGDYPMSDLTQRESEGRSGSEKSKQFGPDGAPFPSMSRAVPSGRREGMFPGRSSEIFGLGERLGCILNLGHSFDAIEAYL